MVSVFDLNPPEIENTDQFGQLTEVNSGNFLKNTLKNVGQLVQFGQCFRPDDDGQVENADH